MLGVEGNSDTDAGDNFVMANGETRLEGALHSPRQLDCFLSPGRRGENQGEFIAAHARQRVAGTNDALHAMGQLAEQLIARLMAQRVVYELEAVNVEEHQSNRLAGAFAVGDRLLQMILEEQAVGQ